MDKEKQPNSASPRAVELLAPARNAQIAIAAIDHGADAVYMGASALGARKEAANSADDLRLAADYAHRFGARVYVTLNTIVYEQELERARQLAWECYRAGADALIVQDMALTQMNDMPPIPLHASTQCDNRTPEKVRLLQEAGFSQVVLARELSLEEIRAIHQATDVPLEVFVHGALCVSFSGDCRASLLTTGRSANRGECCQVCRWPFDLEDAKGQKLVKGKHLLSLKDMNRLDRLADLLEAGATSLKIEGRLKDETYVKTVVSAYRTALDKIIDAHPTLYRRSSRGRVERSFNPDVSLVFNRGFTDYFLNGPSTKMAEQRTPKWVGKEIGHVVAYDGRQLRVKADVPLHNGDGLAYFDTLGQFTGFRVNWAEGDVVRPARKLENIAPGTTLYRNADKQADDQMAGKTAVRVRDTDMRLHIEEGKLTLDMEAEGVKGSAVVDYSPQEARTPQEEARRRVLEKLGDTEFRLHHLDDETGTCFIPASTLADLRRKAVEACRAQADKLRTPQATPPAKHVPVALPASSTATAASLHAANVANSLARKFYDERGIAAPEAAEVERPRGESVVMETRYCLRRELGQCLKTDGGRVIKGPLYLVSHNNRFRLDFDCSRCLMHVVKTQEPQE